MPKKFDAVFELFPDFEEKIDFLFQNDENFRDLCSDYILCTAMVLERKNGMHKNREELAEFEALQRDMEKEIMKEIRKEKIPFKLNERNY